MLMIWERTRLWSETDVSRGMIETVIEACRGTRNMCNLTWSESTVKSGHIELSLAIFQLV